MQRVSWVRGSGGTLETKVKTGFYSGCNWKSLESFNWVVGVGVDLLLWGECTVGGKNRNREAV